MRVLIKCDNQSVVSVLTTGKTPSSVIPMYVRNIFLWLSAFKIDIKVVQLNPVADLLTRCYITLKNVQRLG